MKRQHLRPNWQQKAVRNLQIQRLKAAGTPGTVLARRFGLTNQRISQITKANQYQHTNDPTVQS